MKIILLSILSFLYLEGNAQKTPATNKPVSATKDWLQYKDSVQHFSFPYPSDWTIRVAAPTEKSKIFVRSPSEGVEDFFIENLNLMIRPIGDNSIPGKELQTSIKKALASKFKDFVLIKEKFLNWNGVQAYQIEYTGTQVSGTEETPVWIVQLVANKNKNLYTLTYVSHKNGPIDFYNKALKIMQSFTLP